MQNIKILAYRFLLDAQIRTLNTPIETLKELLKCRNIVLLAYSEADIIKRKVPEDIWPFVATGMRQNEGISIICHHITFILYSDELSYGKKIQAIYHELGHISAGHKRENIFNFEENIDQEYEANTFACYAIAPPCILNEIGDITAGFIAKLTGLDDVSANEAMLLIENEKNKNLIAEEKELLHQFKTYIYANKVVTKPTKKLIRRVTVLCVIPILCITMLGMALQKHTANITAVSTRSPHVIEPTASVDEKIVWKSKTGDVYHTDPNCYHINKSAHIMELSDATIAGYRKCKDCR